MEESAIANTSAGEAVRTELSKIMSDPSHPHYEGFRRRDPKAEEYVNDLYKRTYGAERVTFGHGVTIESALPAPQQSTADPDSEGPSREARHAQAQAELRLQQAMGDSFEPELRSARSMAAQLFTSAESLKVSDEVFAPLISGLGPHGEALAVRFLADLNRLHINN
jgi:hypothetical protein